MTASFLKRLTSSIIDLVLVFVVVYFAFVVGGRTLLQNRVENFDSLYTSYYDLIGTYNEDVDLIQTEYEANMELANGDAELEALAQETYNMKAQILQMQNQIDTVPDYEYLSGYFLESIYFYAIGFIILMTVLTMATKSKTPGRWLMKVRLATMKANNEYGSPNIIQVFFHDIMLKYFFLVVVFTLNWVYGGILILVSLAVDFIFMAFTRNRSTIRDYFLRLKVINQ